jgi:hypothetical protein
VSDEATKVTVDTHLAPILIIIDELVKHFRCSTGAGNPSNCELKVEDLWIRECDGSVMRALVQNILRQSFLRVHSVDKSGHLDSCRNAVMFSINRRCLARIQCCCMLSEKL